MLFAIKYHAKAGRTEAEARRVREIIMAWTPPAAVEVQNHYHYVGGGGVVVAESDSARSLYEMVEPFKPLVNFQVEPMLNVIEALAVSLATEEWVDSVWDSHDARTNGDSEPTQLRLLSRRR